MCVYACVHVDTQPYVWTSTCTVHMWYLCMFMYVACASVKFIEITYYPGMTRTQLVEQIIGYLLTSTYDTRDTNKEEVKPILSWQDMTLGQAHPIYLALYNCTDSDLRFCFTMTTWAQPSNSKILIQQRGSAKQTRKFRLYEEPPLH